ncbi:prolyl oligopeptidase family serine peptidase [Aquimarina sp. RZ0]|uniref:prolyl oligopeptidase family serine peptidase n=1 Tax=Aquimarina sp. RZ0 TaxID=2607730 RepID=UPI00165EF52F|nr:prolyl oligopeptidase family serine peptidase [Aquimarina sp. RZ0]
MVKNIITLLFLFITTLIFSQKKSISHNDYDLWKSIHDVTISNTGKLVVSTIKTATKRGDGHIEIYNTKDKEKFTFFNGYDASVTNDENFVIFKRKPKYEVLREEKKKKEKNDSRSKDDLFIYDVKNKVLYDSILNVKKYEIPKEKEGWIVIEKYKEQKKEKKKEEKDSLTKAKKDSLKNKIGEAFKQDYALIYILKTKKKDTIHHIKDIAVPRRGDTFYFSLKNEKKKGKDLGVYKYDILSKSRTTIDTSHYVYEKLSVDKTGKQFSFISAKDSTAVDSLKFEVFYYTNEKLTRLIDTLGRNLRDHWELSKDQSPSFSESGDRLFFNSKPILAYAKDTILLEDEKPQVDVWNWQDKIIQPEQKSRFDELNKKSYTSYYDTTKKIYVDIQDETINELIFDNNKEQRYILGFTGYNDLERSWNLPWKGDFYIIDTYTGEKRLGLRNAGLDPILSPDGKYALYYDLSGKNWFSINLSTTKKVNLTNTLDVAFYNEDEDRPMLPYPYGFGGFDKEGNALLFDKYDIWKVSLSTQSIPVNITGNGRKNETEYRTQRLDKENKNMASYIGGSLMITSFSKKTKASGLYGLKNNRLQEKIKPTEFFINQYRKAKKGTIFTFRKQNFNTFQDVHVTNNNFSTIAQITEANPHKKEFKWGTAELFSWKTYDGKPLEGIVYKPEDFDPSKKYPLITYFYEKRSDSYRRYYTPRPSASIVNPSYLVSNDYIMFVPDIVYEDGKPGPSAYNCIVSGVEALEQSGYIDRKNMAIQGQSWGGYQVAYLITVTNKFKAAMAGAPVSNMTSAYGGIRWQSGLSRAFQYEKSQSRIGKNLWDGFDLYIENSPLFGIPKIQTPLLMMHNDNDGAVPYYQGIEMFMGMRRLQKPVWLLVYNDEGHNLRKEKNKQDLSIRMMQFFDHYLKREPAPKWMTKGVSRVEKGKDFGYDLEETETKMVIPSSNE